MTTEANAETQAVWDDLVAVLQQACAVLGIWNQRAMSDPPSISDIQETTCGHHWDVHRGDHMPTFCTTPGCSCQIWTRPA